MHAGDRIRRLKSSGASEDVIRENQKEVWRRGASFLADLIGPEAYPEILTGEYAMEYAAVYLHALRPLFPTPPDPAGIFWSELLNEIGRLPYGDEPSLLKPEARSPGQPTRPAKIAFLRLRALEWADFWKSVGARPKDYQRAIELAFGTDWDAIRHWPKSIIKVIGRTTFDQWLMYAPDGYFIDHRSGHVTLMDPLRSDGEWYRSAIGLSDLSDDVIHKEWENLTRSLSVHAGLSDRYQP